VQHSIEAPERDPREAGIQSVRRAAALLRAFGDGAPELGVSELGRRLNLHKSTVSRLLATLESEGLLERAPGTDKYRLGREIQRLAGHMPPAGDVHAIARPFMVELAEQTRETTNLAVLDGAEVHNIDQANGPHLVHVGNWVGRRTPLHCVANGKALLAHQPAAALARLLAEPLAAYTPHTITDPAALAAELDRVRAQGYAGAVSEFEIGLNGVAAPIFAADGTAVAALSISGPAYRLPLKRLPDFAARTVAAARTISTHLGCPPAPAG
jgi:DNA-binding IclR family transcriptional regulator